MLNITWDTNKASINLEKHRISFDEAKTVFYDDHARLLDDQDHSEEEDRFLLLGMSLKARILLVCHCYREDSHFIRIISARKASRKESQQYRRYKQ